MSPETGELMRSLQSFRKKICGVKISDELTTMEFGAMEIIRQSARESGEKQVRVSDISNGLQVSKPMMSKILGVLEKQGYVCREGSDRDRRVACISLTESGQQVLQRAAGDYDRFTDWILSRLGKENARVLRDLVDRFSEILSEADGECPWKM